MGKRLINIGALFLIAFLLVHFLVIPLCFYTTAHSVLSAHDYETMKLRYIAETEKEWQINLVWSCNCVLAGAGATLIILGNITKRRKSD